MPAHPAPALADPVVAAHPAEAVAEVAVAVPDQPMEQTYERVVDVVDMLRTQRIEPVIYGSVAVSFYLGRYKETFDDIDVLIEGGWVETKWDKLVSFMDSEGYELTDPKEHTFENGEKGIVVGFADRAVLERDGICSSDDIVSVRVSGHDISTLSAENMLRAYEFSVKDGYRLEARGKKDSDVITALRDYITRQ